MCGYLGFETESFIDIDVPFWWHIVSFQHQRSFHIVYQRWRLHQVVYHKVMVIVLVLRLQVRCPDNEIEWIYIIKSVER